MDTHIHVLYATVYICTSQGEPHLAYACFQQGRLCGMLYMSHNLSCYYCALYMLDMACVENLLTLKKKRTTNKITIWDYGKIITGIYTCHQLLPINTLLTYTVITCEQQELYNYQDSRGMGVRCLRQMQSLHQSYNQFLFFRALGGT